ncbi:MAG: putative Ig domain-containing protein [Ignavibacteriales bacterium]|nr:putative Ig domain-containing protein [Ignavibacteriales bacterium]
MSSVLRIAICLLFVLGTAKSQEITLLQPTDGLKHQNSRSVTFRWEGNYEYYRLLIGKNIESLSLHGDKITIPEYTVSELDTNQIYYWRIIGFNNAQIDTSMVISFSTDDAILKITKSYITDNTVKIDSALIDLLPSKTAIVLVDFVKQTLPPDSILSPAMQNAIELIESSRRHGILVIHVIHDYDYYVKPKKGEIVVKSDPIHWKGQVFKVIDDNVNLQLLYDDPGIESYLKSVGINNLLYFGFSPSECVLWSRYNSVYNVHKRNPDIFNTVLVSDCSETDSSQYEWTLDIFRERYSLTNLSEVAKALGDSINVKKLILENKSDYNNNFNGNIGSDIRKNTAIIVLNLSNEYLEKNSASTQRYEASIQLTKGLISFARVYQLPIVFINNYSQGNLGITPEPGDISIFGNSFKDEQLLWNYLNDFGIQDMIVTGVISDKSSLFPMSDPGSLTFHRNGGYFAEDKSWRTFFLEDCIYADTIQFNLSSDTIKAIYLHLATGDGLSVDQYKTSMFSILRHNTNKLPSIIPIPNQVAVEDNIFEYHVSAFDPDSAQDNDYVTFRLVHKPSWLSIDRITGTISGTPLIYNLYDTVVVVEALDQYSGVTYQQFSISITHVNHIPEIVSIGSFVAQEDSLYTYQVRTEDPDTLVGDVLTYSLTKKPSWLSIHSGTGLISGIPRGHNVGDTLVTVRVADGKGGIASQAYPISVRHTNHAPVFVTQVDTTAIEDSLYVYTVRASDQDSVLFGDIVRYRLSVKPKWLRIDSVSGVITGTPAGMQARDTVVDIQAIDNKGGIGEQSFTLHVQHVNHPPVITSLPDTVASEDSLYTYHIKASDPDVVFFGDSLRIKNIILPLWLKIYGDSLVAGTPGWLNVGDTLAAFVLSDGRGGEILQNWVIRIFHINHKPIVGSLLFPQPEDTIILKEPPVPIKFVWNSAKDKDIVDTLHYIITIQGPGLDTTIAGIKDTMVSMTFMKRLKQSSRYRWWIEVNDGYATVASYDTNKFKTSDKITSVFVKGSAIPKMYALAQNYPNPFNPTTMVQYDLPEESQIRLTVHNLLGQIVGVIFDGIQHAGRYEINWRPASASSGIYFLIMEAKGQTENQTHFRAVIRMLLLR